MVAHRERAAEKKAEAERDENITGAHPHAGKGEVQRGIKPHHAETLIPPALAEERSGKIPARGGRNKAYKAERQRRPFRARKPAAREAVFPVEREAETHKDKHDRRHGKADRFRFRYIKKTVVNGKRQQREHQEEIPAAEPCFNGWFYFCFHRFAASLFSHDTIKISLPSIIADGRDSKKV